MCVRVYVCMCACACACVHVCYNVLMSLWTQHSCTAHSHFSPPFFQFLFQKRFKPIISLIYAGVFAFSQPSAHLQTSYNCFSFHTVFNF